jgi:hypothetical protein
LDILTHFRGDKIYVCLASRKYATRRPHKDLDL